MRTAVSSRNGALRDFNAAVRLIPEVEYPTFLEDCAAGLAPTAARAPEPLGAPGR